MPAPTTHAAETPMSSPSARPITHEQVARWVEQASGGTRTSPAVAPPPGFRHGYRIARVASLLHQYAYSNRVGRVAVTVGIIADETGESVQSSDVAFWSAEHLPFDQEPDDYSDVLPDLCIEIMSARSRRGEVRRKVSDFITRGVRMAWIIDLEERTLTVYRSPDEGRVLHETATLSGDDVLPGFLCKVMEFFS